MYQTPRQPTQRLHRPTHPMIAAQHPQHLGLRVADRPPRGPFGQRGRRPLGFDAQAFLQGETRGFPRRPRFVAIAPQTHGAEPRIQVAARRLGTPPIPFVRHTHLGRWFLGFQVVQGPLPDDAAQVPHLLGQRALELPEAHRRHRLIQEALDLANEFLQPGAHALAQFAAAARQRGCQRGRVGSRGIHGASFPGERRLGCITAHCPERRPLFPTRPTRSCQTQAANRAQAGFFPSLFPAGSDCTPT
jgi:hypothetical protein